MCPSMPLWSSVAWRSCVRPSRFLGITRRWVGAWGFTSLNTRQWSSSKTISEGISFAIILSKMVAGAVSRFPAPWIVSQRPFSSHPLRAPVISSYTLAKLASLTLTQLNHRERLAPKQASWLHVLPLGSNFGSMYSAKMRVGKRVASASDTSSPATYGPFSSTCESTMRSCLRNSSICWGLDGHLPKGGTSLYMHCWFPAR
mmetsp:Transcript_38950/g.90864  ORF Transcript_38950/g.90864 Transcript_38950/m.90864 type:complete len:201 (-) Transcript_38950:520-1122(-)